MKKTLKKYFIPHEENNYHPHILHTKRAFFYGGLFIAMKGIVFIFALFLPLEVFVMPDVLAEQQREIIALVGEIRGRELRPHLSEVSLLDRSAEAKAEDMATNKYFDHVGPNNHGLSYFLDAVGYHYLSAGENLAMGFSDARDVVNAWIKSPTHYANVIDPEYREVGVSLASGYVDGVPTVYVVQHLGSPDNPIAPAKPRRPISPAANKIIVTTPSSSEQKIAGLNIQSTASATEPIVSDKKTSLVHWAPQGDGMKIWVNAAISGPVIAASVSIGDTTIVLHQDRDEYVGSVNIAKTPQEFFKVIIPPIMEIKSQAGETTTAAIAWQTVKIFSPTPVQKYLQAKHSLGFLTDIFAISKNIYGLFLVFFSLALLLNIFIEIKKQHHHIIAQMIGLIGLLLYFYVT
ncbi:MAG: hypothetical protein HY984_02420 [Candidatus Magasanikbacteria bacterium]|nr:hypothetical protein [Candidatus Magasanikbacteria bacterium]